MAYAHQMDANGFIWWYRTNGIKGTLGERFKAYCKFRGIK